MEQPSGKIEKLLLAAGLIAALTALGFQHFSPVSRALRDGKEVRVALLGEKSSVLFIYHPSSSTVNALSFTRDRARRGVPASRRACDLSEAAGAVSGAEDAFYISFSSAPDMEVLWTALSSWRAEPRIFFRAAAWARDLRRSGGTNIGAFDLFSLFSEFCRLSSSNFILTESVRQTLPGPEPASDEPALRVEVFNASGRKDMAALAAKYLRGQGFDVITAASYNAREKRTEIHSFSGDASVALKLRSALGRGELEIYARPGEKSVAGAAVILGEDFDESFFTK